MSLHLFDSRNVATTKRKTEMKILKRQPTGIDWKANLI